MKVILRSNCYRPTDIFKTVHNWGLKVKINKPRISSVRCLEIQRQTTFSLIYSLHFISITLVNNHDNEFILVFTIPVRVTMYTIK